MKVGGVEMVLNEGGGSYTISKMGVEKVFDGCDGGNSVGNRGYSSTMASSLPKKRRKTDEQFFGKRKFKLSALIILFSRIAFMPGGIRIDIKK